MKPTPIWIYSYLQQKMLDYYQSGGFAKFIGRSVTHGFICCG